MKRRKIYIITIKEEFLNKVIEELDFWRAGIHDYQLDSNIIKTSDANVVDVITETFDKNAYFIQVQQ